MKFLPRILMFFFLMLAMNSMAKGNTTEKASIASAIKVLSLNTDNLQQGTTVRNIKGHKVAIRLNESGVVEHIGIPVFMSDMRNINPLPVYDYVEYALLEHVFNIQSGMKAFGHLSFAVGSWDTLENLPKTAVCTISNSDTKYYEVCWSVGDKTLVSFKMPFQYDVLQLSNKSELEGITIDGLSKADSQRADKQPVTDKQMFSDKYVNGDIYMKDGYTYLQKNITSNLYYLKKGTDYKLFCSSRYPAESLANVLLTSDANLPKAVLNITSVLYDGSKKKMELPVSSWLNYMESRGCKIYYGFDHIDDTKAHVVLYASNPTCGYDHVLMLTCPLDSLDGKSLSLDGTLYLFSPTTNIQNIFYKR